MDIDELRKQMTNEQLIIWEVHQLNRQITKINEHLNTLDITINTLGNEIISILKSINNGDNLVEIQRGQRLNKNLIENITKTMEGFRQDVRKSEEADR